MASIHSDEEQYGAALNGAIDSYRQFVFLLTDLSNASPASLTEASAWYDQAALVEERLKVFSKSDFPLPHLEIANQLGVLLGDSVNWVGSFDGKDSLDQISEEARNRLDNLAARPQLADEALDAAFAWSAVFVP